MADMYVDDNGSNTSPYDTWAKAATAMATALAAQAAGERIFVSSDHSEVLSVNTIYTSTNGTQLNPVIIISADKTSGEPPTTYETMVTGGGSFDLKTGGAYDLNVEGNDTWIGCCFIVGDDMEMRGGPAITTKLIDCKVEVDDRLLIGYENCESALLWDNVDYVQASPGEIRPHGGRFVWRGGSFAFNGGSLPSSLFKKDTGVNRTIYAMIEDVDFSAITDAGDYLVEGGAISSDKYLFKRCKLSGTYGGVLSTPITQSGMEVKLINCSSSDVDYNFEEHYCEGVIYEETSVYLDKEINGVDACIKMVSSAYAREWIRPLKFMLDNRNCDANPTITVEIVVDDATTWNDDDFWLEIEQPDGTIKAFGLVKDTRPTTILTTPSAMTTSVVSWTGTGGFSNEQKRKVSIVLTGGAAGIHTVWACVGKPSATVYVNLPDYS